MNFRKQKLESQIRRILSTALLRDVADPRVMGLVSITHIELTEDLHDCKVHVSILSETPAGTVMQGIVSARPTIQRTLAKNLATRSVPRLHFVLDESLKKQSEVLELLKQVSKSAASPQTGAAPPEAAGGKTNTGMSGPELNRTPIEEME